MKGYQCEQCQLFYPGQPQGEFFWKNPDPDAKYRTEEAHLCGDCADELASTLGILPRAAEGDA